MARSGGKFHIKHIELWIIGFFIALAGAVIGLTYAFVGKNPTPAQYYEIVAEDKSPIDGYAKDFNFYCYLDDKGKSITEKRKELTTLYSDNLSSLYATTHEYETYPGFTSISALSKTPNTDITFDKKTYDILKDAYNKTLDSNNYSVFADELYSFWNELSRSSETIQKQKDPLYNLDSQETLEELVSYINDRDHVDLIFKEGNVINLMVSETYMAYMETYTEEPIYVGLNVLKNNYILDSIAQDVEDKGYKNAYFYLSDGSVVLLDEAKDALKYNLYTYAENREGRTFLALIEDGRAPMVTSTFYRFNLNGDYYHTYYIIEKDGIKYFRSQYIDIHTGLNNNAYMTTNLYAHAGSSVQLAFLNNELIPMKNAAEIRDYLNNNGKQNTIMIALFNDGSNNIYVTENIYDYISVSQAVDYNLVKF